MQTDFPDFTDLYPGTLTGTRPGRTGLGQALIG
jgi:hypothetical protein